MKPDPAGAYRLPAGLGRDHHARVIGIGQAAPEHAGQPVVIVAPDGLLHVPDPLQVRSLRDLAQRHARHPARVRPRARARARACGQPRALADQQRLGVFRHEPGGGQPFRQVGRPVMAVVLPLRLDPEPREMVALQGDEVVQRRARQASQVTVGNEASFAGKYLPDDRAAPVRPARGNFRGGDPCPDLLVVGRQVDLARRHALPRAIAIRRSSTWPLLTRRPSCSYSFVTQARRPRIAAAVWTEYSAGTYMSP